MEQGKNVRSPPLEEEGVAGTTCNKLKEALQSPSPCITVGENVRNQEVKSFKEEGDWKVL